MTKGVVLMVNHTAIPSFLMSVMMPVPSTCPETICPPNLPSAAMARSRFTLAPLMSPPGEARFKVSCMTSALNIPCESSVTVRQIPFTAILSPGLVPSSTFEAQILSLAEIGFFIMSAITPVSSTIPVNIRYILL